MRSDLRWRRWRRHGWCNEGIEVLEERSHAADLKLHPRQVAKIVLKGGQRRHRKSPQPSEVPTPPPDQVIRAGQQVKHDINQHLPAGSDVSRFCPLILRVADSTSAGDEDHCARA